MPARPGPTPRVVGPGRESSALLQRGERSGVVRLFLDLGHELRVHHLVARIEHDHATRSHPGERTGGDRHAVGFAELIKGIIVLSGNDACVVVAEGLAGTEAAFARQMTERGKALGLTNSTFANASGWPDPRHRMSVHDLGVLAQHLIQDFPEYYKNFAIEEWRFDNRAPANRHNRNPLLGLGIGADGLKTGHTQEAGYGLVGSAIQGDRRIIFVISGLPSDKARAEEAERIVNWAYRQFTMKTIIPKGEIVAQAPVWLGSSGKVGLTTEDGVKVLIPAGSQSGVTAEAVFKGPIEAPIAAGDRLGDLVVNIPGAGQSRLPLIAATEISRAGVLGRLQSAAFRLGERAYQSATN